MGALLCYEPLPPGKWTRILLLEPGTFGDPIKCSLRSVAFYDTEPYEAISYVWGNLDEVQTITCHGVSVVVTANLFQALRQVRHPTKQRHLWVDALCMNQHDKFEKSSQVNIMGEIYSQAKQVLICFGDDDQNGRAAEEAFSVIRDFNIVAAKHMRHFEISPHTIKRWAPPDGSYGPVTRARLQSAVDMLNRPWFERVWVLQEVGLARRALLAYGRSTVDFIEVLDFVAAWVRNNQITRGLVFKAGHIISLFRFVWATFTEDVEESWYSSSHILKRIARLQKDGSALELEDVLFRARGGQRATDKEDLVYAFLGHPRARSSDGELLIEADYTRTLPELKFCLFSQMSVRSLRFLSLIWHRFPKDLVDGPSWCPRLNSRRHWTINNRYDASRGVEQTTEGSGVQGSCLQVYAYILDSIHLCGEICGTVIGRERTEEDDNSAEEVKISVDLARSLLSQEPSIVQKYWDVLEKTEADVGLTYPDKALAFACTLLHAVQTESKLPRSGAIARSFVEYCQGKCPLIYDYLSRKRWLRAWNSAADPRTVSFVERAVRCCNGDRFFTTKGGFCGTGTPLIQPGDLICVVPTVQPPLVIRPVAGNQHRYHIIGSCYVHGVMYGEMWENTGSEKKVLKQTLVEFV
ncbi:het domain-containing protein [Colletotrichum kahawae]|uniref:Het domain-containing protein n=1 Tax=Colletotrichum kahawae TaxID=34407 RepID=A0AAD9Y653_COLKA|nr:het domain-containing protein [Colletotrichum kahawae]